jgi:hypothetical protein
MKILKDILGSVIEIKKDYERFTKGERYLVITREATDDSLRYELELLESPLPIRRVWCTNELLTQLKVRKIIKI